MSINNNNNNNDIEIVTSFNLEDKLSIDENNLTTEEIEKLCNSIKHKKKSQFKALLYTDFVMLNTTKRKKNDAKKRSNPFLVYFFIALAVFISSLFYSIYPIVIEYLSEKTLPAQSIDYQNFLVPLLMAIILVPSYFIMDKKFDVVQAMPINPYTRIGVKLLLSFLYIFPITLISFLIATLGQIVLGLTPAILLTDILFSLLFSIIGVSLVYNVFIVVSKIFKKNLLVIIFTSLISLIVIGIYPILSYIDLQNFNSTSVNVPFNLFYTFNNSTYSFNLFYIFNYFDISTLFTFLIFLGVLIINIFFTFILTKTLYFKTINKDSYFKKKKKTMSDDVKIKKYKSESSLLFSYHVKNVKKNVNLLLQVSGWISFSTFFIIACVLFGLYVSKGKIPFVTKDFSFAFLTYVISLFSCSPLLVMQAATVISRESKNMLFLKSLKIDFRKYILTKVFWESLLPSIQAILMYMIVGMIFYIPISVFVISILTIPFLIFSLYSLIAMIDFAKPHLYIDEETSIIQNNLNIFLGYLIVIGVCLLIASLSIYELVFNLVIGLFSLEHLYQLVIYQLVVTIFLAVIFVVTALICYKFVVKFFIRKWEGYNV